MFDDLSKEGMDVTELLVATPDHGDPGLEPCVQDVLHLVREKMKLAAVFVRAVRPDGQRDVFAAESAASHPLEAAWGEHLLGEHLPQGDAASRVHQNAPVTLADGSVYGTLCVCSRDQWTAQTDLKLLRSTALLIAQKLGGGRRPLLAGHRPSWGDLRAAAGARPRFEGDPTRP